VKQAPDGSVEGVVPIAPAPPLATRKSIQIGRRAFHMANGVVAATAYALFFTHTQAVYILGTVACLVYFLEQIRISYPELIRQAPWIERGFLRAEEQAKESGMIPYAIAILLAIITFPKEAALIAIYTLALADPISAIVGIKFGRRHVVPDKTVEGSFAFFAVTLLVAAGVLTRGTDASHWAVFGASAVIACRRRCSRCCRCVSTTTSRFRSSSASSCGSPPRCSESSSSSAERRPTSWAPPSRVCR
jgi:dolichol kinase